MIKPKKAVLEMEDYSPPTSGRENKLRLDFNENTIGCSPKVIQALRQVDANKLSVYPEYTKFMKKLASFLKINENELLLTNATDEAIQLVMNTFVEKGDEVIIPVPTFAMFKFYASLAEAKIKEVLYEEDLTYPIDSIINSISSKTKIVILVNPNNPTGTAILEKDILQIIQKAQDNDALVLVDEAYYEFYGKSCLELIRKYENVIITRTFSKAYGLAGMRIGYIVANSKTMGFLEKAGSPYSINSLAVIAAEAALEDYRYMNDYVREVNENKSFVENELARLGIKTYSSEANFLIANFGNLCESIYERLKQKDILVRNRTKDQLLKNCLRIGIGTKKQCNQFIKTLKEILKEDVLLFDLDGVLVDVSNSYRLAIKETAEFFTKQKAVNDEIQKFKEQGGLNNDWDLTEAIISSRNVNVSKEEIIKKFQELYLGENKKNGFIDNETWLLPKKILQNLYRKYRLGIVTGRPKEEALYVLQKNGALEFFDVIITMQDYPEDKAKPNPFSINLALEKLGRKNAVYIGDSIDDMKAAQNAKIMAIGVMPPNISSYRLKQLMKANGAMKILNDITQIEQILMEGGQK
ncbi:MAG: histidinol-phosphate transaminase [Candidatus Woesearchaeota archaeon]|nr:histidinol-phosphate transaminase [Candidatus Woesearchaeota archaeon]